MPDNAVRPGILAQIMAGNLRQICGAKHVHCRPAVAGERNMLAIGRGRELVRVGAAGQAQHFFAGGKVDL